LYGEGFPSNDEDDSASFINDEKPSGEMATTEHFPQTTFTFVVGRNGIDRVNIVKDVTLKMVGEHSKILCFTKVASELEWSWPFMM
jgi:hypothetical protein